MSPDRFASLTGRYGTLRIAVVGDFCLDRYYEIDPALAEVSIETGRTVHNVVNLRAQPGGAGTVVNNLRLQAGLNVVRGHSFYVVDLQDGGGWDWTQGEPPKTNPAYYLRFCKSYARMGGAMHYLPCDNAAFVRGLYARLRAS